MDDKDYARKVDDALADVASWLEDFDPDVLDYQTSDGVITLAFADKTRFVLNRQSAVHQVWFAAGARAWHYVWDEARGTWTDDRDGHALYDNIARVVAAKLGNRVPPIAG